MSAYRDARPLAVLLIIAGALVGGTALAREVIGGAGFLVERPAIVVVWLVGLLLGPAVFGWTTSRSGRQAEQEPERLSNSGAHPSDPKPEGAGRPMSVQPSKPHRLKTSAFRSPWISAMARRSSARTGKTRLIA